MTGSLFDAREMRRLAHQAVTEGVNLKYVERMRQALYAAADRIELLESGDAKAAACTCPNRDTIVGNCPIHGDRMRLSTPPKHVCQPPTIAGLTHPQQPDWECAKCGRIWRDWVAGSLRYWAELRGPTHFPRGETL